MYWYYMTISSLHKHVYTSMYAYIRVQTFLFAFEKGANRSWTRYLLHASCRTNPYTTGVQTSALDLCFQVCWLQCIYSLPSPSVSAPGGWCRIYRAAPQPPAMTQDSLGAQHSAVQLPTQLSRLDTCCWWDPSGSSLCENRDVLWPMRCVAYVRCELCKQSAQQQRMVPKILEKRLAHSLMLWDAMRRRGHSEFDMSLDTTRIDISESSHFWTLTYVSCQW